MKIVAVANRKGGVGKTFVSCILAELMMIAGKRVAVVDLDDQLNSVEHLRKMDGTPVYPMIDVFESPEQEPDYKKLKDYDVVIVDTPPLRSSDEAVLKVIKKSDVLVIPIILNRHTVFGLENSLELLPEGKPILPVCGHVPESALSREKKEILKLVDEQLGKDQGDLKRVVHLPWYDRVDTNLSDRRDFFYGLSEKQYEPFDQLSSALLKLIY